MIATPSDAEYRAILTACKKLRKPRGNYHDNDFVSVLVDTVIDYRLNETITGRAYTHFEKNHWERLRSCRQLCRFLDKFPDSKEGNARAAKTLWGYSYGQRFRQLRQLVSYFRRVGVRDQRSLRRWARESNFERDFKGEVKGLAFAVYKWLVMRVGVETVKPDSRLRGFLRRVSGREFSDEDVVSVLDRTAKAIGWKAHILDWAIWETEGARTSQRGSR